MKESILVKKQAKTFNTTLKNSKLYPDCNGAYLKVTIRYDDECGNGYNSFSITGEASGKLGLSGCIHDLIIEQMPELKKYIKWHLTSSDGPMQYVANSMYYALEVKKDTVVKSYEERLKFRDIPFTFELSKRLKDFISVEKNLENIQVVNLVHENNGCDAYQYSDNYSFFGCSTKWYENLFSEKKDAEEMAQALMNYKYDIVKTVSSYEDEKKPDLEAARISAVWPEAKLSDFTKEKLDARLDGLLFDFQNDILELGFIY